MALVFEAVVLLAIVCIVLQVYLRKSATKSAQQEVGSKAFFSFQRNYLIVYYLAMGADWLQGPYVYALYETYGFQKSEIAQLFVGGFFSSMVFGTFVGSLADKYGRKLFSILYAVFYILACMTKWVPDYNILMIGRILSGISTSLLFCVFESWMVAEHNERKHPASLVGSTFSTATIGNGVVAIVAGLVASYVAENYGFVAPFMAAAVLLVVLIFAILSTWTENYGNTSVQWQATMTDAIQCIRNDRRISSLGLVQSLFEASMYTFVFMWTPTIQDAYEATFSVTQSDLLQVGDDNINGKFGDGDDGNIDSAEPLAYGTMFAAFMVSLMVGSSLFSIGIRQMSEEQIGSCVLPAAALCLLVPAVTTNYYLVFASFLMFEACVGIYFPCFGTLRSKYVPEKTRSAVLSFFRVPLNFMVIVVLLKVTLFTNHTIFVFCATWMLISFLTFHFVFRSACAAQEPPALSQRVASGE